MNILFSTQAGSRLYGTQTLTSDIDWKHIMLPDINDLLLCKRIENKVKKTNNVKNTRNSADDVDEEFIPIQVFAKDFLAGQTYALELAFAIDGTHAAQTFDNSTKDLFKMFVMELRDHFMTSNIKAMMGYVVNQASLYSFKGERLNLVREVRKILEQYVLEDGDHRLGFFASAYIWKDLSLKYPKYFKIEDYDIGGGEIRPCFKLLEKTLPHTDKVEHALKTVSSLESKYGGRADAATESNVDWKATMHALRIVDEGLDLLANHKLSFPLEKSYVERLLSIKRGELSLDPIKEELATKLDSLKILEKSTTLPPVSPELTEKFEKWLVNWMRCFYQL